ncbi:integrin alpha-E isoform X2 [Triplophysa dalaica]|uniref:integrin alpha-E isoform X2 n=1 Tax=Triplophysa dalaica TaxID=1582913 RepID=UPI0024DFF65B|nr:integrin alpha-E isoform X2 [Triplophysa dalaica]
MYIGVIFMIVISCVNGFNIQTTPVKNFTNDDPLFGQTVINSTDGVLVPSPQSGKLFKCTLKNDCVLVNSPGETTKGLKSMGSVASRVISEDEHILVCSQFRTRDRSIEYLNGNCTMINGDRTVKLNPHELVSNLNATHNNNEGVKERRKRDIQRPTESDDDEEEDPRTEISFVLDGSGSIQPDDFQKAKTFIYNVMSNVWETCFDCDFAVVQYGFDIKTELSLRDNEDGAEALKKVQKIQQLGRVTKTASAIHHVLTNIFVPENGSKNNSRKMIIVLSDGEILGDPMNLTDVLNMPQMEEITRFAIGVGDNLKPEAVEEMKEIADTNNFFHVSNYAALNNILSQLQQSITGIEGTGGFQLQLAEAGFSSHIMHDRSLLFGAVGAYEWSGGIIVKSEDNVQFFNDSNNGPKFSYLGYSVASAHLPSKTLYISGAPRYNLTGGVFIFEGSEKYVLQGEQVGSYYGSVICTLDIDMNGYTDHLLVGAPHFHQYGEEGKVLVYRLNQGRFERFESVNMKLQVDAGHTFARFGAAIASIGDIDGNSYGDIAVGAPLETDASGSIYIYNGFKDCLRFSQKISPADFGSKLVNFGLSVSSISSPAQNRPWIAVGSQGKVVVFETIPVMIIIPTINIEPKTITLSQQKQNMFEKFNVCFNIKRGKLKNERLSILYQIDLDFGQHKKRLSVDGESLLKTNFTLDPYNECTDPISFKYLGCFDCFSPIKMKLNFSLAPNSIGTPIRILDVFSKTEIFEEISFEKECRNPEDCKPNIRLSNSKISETLIIVGETQSLNIHFHLTNTEDVSYMTTLTLTYPNILSLKKTEGHCPEGKDGHIQCLPLYPELVFRRGEQTNISIFWQLSDTKPDLHQLINSEIIANLTSKNEVTQILDSKIYKFDVKYSLPIQLTGTATPNRFRIEGGKTDTSKLQFMFKFVGENKYDATIDVDVNITRDTFNTEVIVEKVTPKECLVSTNEVQKSYFIRCSMKILQKIIIDATVSIRDVQEKSDKITAVAQYSFNETMYAAKNTARSATVEVFITKLAVTSSKGSIIGGSIGGLLLLIIIIIILIKCGFFRRRRKMDQAQSPN